MLQHVPLSRPLLAESPERLDLSSSTGPVEGLPAAYSLLIDTYSHIPEPSRRRTMARVGDL